MKKKEWIDQFDLLYNNINSNQAPGLDNYEKSVFCTKAQDEILKSYFNPRLNKTQEGFDGSQRRQIDFSMILKTKDDTAITEIDPLYQPGYFKSTLPEDAMIMINEFLIVDRGSLVVVPLTFQDYNRLLSRPYKRPNNYQAWRLIDEGNSITIIAGSNDRELKILKYICRYIKRPHPIILWDNDNSVSINGHSVPYNPVINNDDPLFQDKETFVESYLSTPIGECFIENVSDPDAIRAAMENAAAEFTGIDHDHAPTAHANAEGLERFLESIKLAVYSDDGFIVQERLTNLNLIRDFYAPFFIYPKGAMADEVCELDPILHEEILQRAVELAKASFQGDLNTQFALGINSETNMGVVPQAKQ